MSIENILIMLGYSLGKCFKVSSPILGLLVFCSMVDPTLSVQTALSIYSLVYVVILSGDVFGYAYSAAMYWKFHGKNLRKLILDEDC